MNTQRYFDLCFIVIIIIDRITDSL